MGGSPLCCWRHNYDVERERIIPKLQNVADPDVSVSEMKQQVNKCEIEIRNLKEKLIEAENEAKEKQRKVIGQEEKLTQYKSKVSEFEKLVEDLKTEKQTLLTRLSEISSIKLTDGNPNIADLSDPNRTDKLVEQFSELYDNQWTDSFQALSQNLDHSEDEAINVLLKIVLKVYELCRGEAEYQNTELGKAVSLFTGVEVVDHKHETIIQESLHNLRSFRAKKYDLAMEVVKRKIGDSLQSLVGSDVYIASQDYIAECIKVCWLMCVKFPSMYISAETEDLFNHDLYSNFTNSGTHVSYVVWPTLFQYENGPVVKKGVAQGINKI